MTRNRQLRSWAFAGALLVFLLIVEPFLPGDSLTSCGANAPKASGSPTEMPHQDKNARCPVPCGVPRGQRAPWFYPRQALSLENSHPLHLLSALVWDLRIRPIYGELLRTLKKRIKVVLLFCFQSSASWQDNKDTQAPVSR